MALGLLAFAPLARYHYPDPTDTSPDGYGFSDLREWAHDLSDPEETAFWIFVVIGAGVVAVAAGAVTIRRRGASFVLVAAALAAVGATTVMTRRPRDVRSITSSALETATGHLQAAIWLLVAGLVAMLAAAVGRWPGPGLRAVIAAGAVVVGSLGVAAAIWVYTADDLAERWSEQRLKFQFMDVQDCATDEPFDRDERADTAVVFEGGWNDETSYGLEQLESMRAVIDSVDDVSPTIDGRPLRLRLGRIACPAEGSEVAAIVGDDLVAVPQMGFDLPEATELGFGPFASVVFVYGENGRLRAARALASSSDVNSLLFDVMRAAETGGAVVDWEYVFD